MICMLLFILTAFAARAPVGYMRMGPHMVPYFRRANGTFTTKTFTSPVPLLGDEVRIYAKSDAKAGDNMSEASTEAASSNVSECGSEFVSTWDALDEGSINNLTHKETQAAAKKFFTDRSAPKNAFGSTVIVNLSGDNVATENKTLAKHIEDFRTQLKAIPDSKDYLDFQQNPHMTVSAVIMDRIVGEVVENEKFEAANTDVKAIQEALRTIEDKNVTLKVEADVALKIPNKAGQFSIQFDKNGQKALKETTADLKKMEDDVKSHFLNRLMSEHDWKRNTPEMLTRFVKAIKTISPSMTEFQKVRFELIDQVGADVKDHFEAMALHIGQIKDPEALKSSKHQQKVAELFARYKLIFAKDTITMKGLQYVRYTSNSLKPESIELLADAKKIF